MTWLITGGAGYIGAHVVRSLQQAGHPLVVLDDLSSGDAARIPGAALVVGSVLDGALVADTMARHQVRGVIHIAGRKQVAESVAQPNFYYRENVAGQLALLEAARDAGVSTFVFSSSAAVYGMTDVPLVTEDLPLRPMSPYGRSKAAGEWMVEDAGRAYGMRYVNLRYFNVAGAASADLGDPAALNLVPMVFERLARGEQPLLFGDDYATPDGTGVRDFIHVEDLADAHVRAAEHLAAGGASATLNIGRGEGSSVREVLRAIAAVTGLDTTPQVLARREGDPARVVACADRAAELLGWTARHDLRAMVTSAWDGWCLRHGAPAARDAA